MSMLSPSHTASMSSSMSRAVEVKKPKRFARSSSFMLSAQKKYAASQRGYKKVDCFFLIVCHCYTHRPCPLWCKPYELSKTTYGGSEAMK